MITTIDEAGKIVIPKEIREQLHFSPNTELEIISDGSEIRIRKINSSAIRVEERSKFLVLDFEGEVNFSKIIQDLREDRIASFL